MTIMMKTLSAFTLSLMLACASDSDDAPSDSGNNEGSADNDVVEATDLRGNWAKACQVAGPAGVVKEALIVQATTLQRIEQSFQSNSTCAGAADVDVRWNYNYTIPSFDPAANNPIDLTLVSLRARLNSTAAVGAANATSFCGFTDWAIGVEKDVTGRNCVPDLPDDAGSPFFQIFKLETEDRLFAGQIDAAHDGQTAAERPTTLESDPYLRVPSLDVPTPTTTSTTSTSSTTSTTQPPTTTSTTTTTTTSTTSTTL